MREEVDGHSQDARLPVPSHPQDKFPALVAACIGICSERFACLPLPALNQVSPNARIGMIVTHVYYVWMAVV
jgi:hypothetical protein